MITYEYCEVMIPVRAKPESGSRGSLLMVRASRRISRTGTPRPVESFRDEVTQAASCADLEDCAEWTCAEWAEYIGGKVGASSCDVSKDGSMGAIAVSSAEMASMPAIGRPGGSQL